MTTCDKYSAGHCSLAGRIDSLRVCLHCPRNTAPGWPDPATLAPVPIIHAPVVKNSLTTDPALAMDAEIDLILPHGLKRGCCG